MESPKRIYPPVYFFLAILVMICLHRLVPMGQMISGPYRYLGVVLLGGGLAVVLWAAGIFRRAGTTIKPFERSSALVVRGPYRVSRNPIYLAMVCGLIGVGVLAGSLTPFLIVPAFAIWIDRRFIRKEEAHLEQTFGSQYGAYRTAVRRWL